MHSYQFREMQESRLQEIADILNYYVLNTTVSFYTQPLSADEMREKVFFKNPVYQSLLIMEEEKLIGWCAVGPWKKQQAYNGTAEIYIYLKPENTGKGIGSLAIQKLEEIAGSRGINNLIAGVCSENIPSIRMFEKMGFSKCAHFQKTGNKFGRLLDVVYLQKISI